MMPTAHAFDDPLMTLEHALSLAPSEGMALEFDVYQGYTLTVIANARKHDQVFDSIPFKAYLRTGARTSQRAHSRPDSFPMSRGAKLVVGWFNDTLADFLANHQTGGVPASGCRPLLVDSHHPPSTSVLGYDPEA